MIFDPEFWVGVLIGFLTAYGTTELIFGNLGF